MRALLVDCPQVFVDELIELGVEVVSKSINLYFESNDDSFCRVHHWKIETHEFDLILINFQSQPTNIALTCKASRAAGDNEYYRTVPGVRLNLRPLLFSEICRDRDPQKLIVLIAPALEEQKIEIWLGGGVGGRERGNYHRVKDRDIVSSTERYLKGLKYPKARKGQRVNVVSTCDLMIKNVLEHWSEETFYQFVGSSISRDYDDGGRIADNDQGAIVSAYLGSRNRRMLILPGVPEEHMGSYLRDVIYNLSDIAPELNFGANVDTWLTDVEYRLPNENELFAEIDEENARHEEVLESIQQRLEENHSQYEFLHGLLTKTSDELVDDVISFLNWLGYAEVINADDELPKGANKQEDIEVKHVNEEGHTKVLIIEVKGIHGTSSDNECMQVLKFINRRMKKAKADKEDVDVYGVYIVNHQRHLSPKNRDYPPFKPEQITDAEESERGLLTTYQLFKSYFDIENGFLSKKDVMDAMFKYGMVRLEPSDERLILKESTLHHQNQVFLAQLREDQTISVGDSILVFQDNEWSYRKVIEIKLNNKITQSLTGQKGGFLLDSRIKPSSKIWLLDHPQDV